ncbi:unnamed protein product [Bathycoccus prasinos]
MATKQHNPNASLSRETAPNGMQQHRPQQQQQQLQQPTATMTTTAMMNASNSMENSWAQAMNKTAQATVVSPIATIDTSNKTPTADDRELKRQRRKQSNRESARRSRLRKQAETEELGNILERYATENMKLREAVEKLASERDIRTENESVLAKCIEDAGNKVPDLKQVEKPFVVSSLELFSSNNINNNDGSDTTTNSGGGEGTNNSTDG